MPRYDSPEEAEAAYQAERDEEAERVAREQAEISFKAGIKEVVEWIEPLFRFYDCPEAECPIYPKWQAKLKEWEVKDGS